MGKRQRVGILLRERSDASKRVVDWQWRVHRGGAQAVADRAGETALERQLGKDREKFGTISAVQDIGTGIPLEDTDYGIMHDVGEW